MNSPETPVYIPFLPSEVAGLEALGMRVMAECLKPADSVELSEDDIMRLCRLAMRVEASVDAARRTA